MTDPIPPIPDPIEPAVAAEEARRFRDADPDFARWAAGYGPIDHSDVTQWRIFQAVERTRRSGELGDDVDPWALLEAADRLACAGMWLTAHQTYARSVYLDGRDLESDDFKHDPQGHLGGALNMVPAYVGYLAANALTGHTRAWLMGQGHCVGGIDSVNVLVRNVTPAHERYDVSEEGLTRFVRDFYGFGLNERGEPASPVGSHVNAHTAGGVAEGGYLGFAELQYMHMPLPGERLVTFLSDGAFEEQRGSDWAPRWWRPGDCGLVAPVMIANGRRIDQRTTMAQSGGVDWFVRHLKLHQFDPILLDGRDPAAFVWAILEIERRERATGRAWAQDPAPPYTFPLPYGVAVTIKGWGFYGAGTIPAHNLPLPEIPRHDRESASLFNESARALWVPPGELFEAAERFQRHETSDRPRERDHVLATRDVTLEAPPRIPERPLPQDRSDRSAWTRSSPMAAVDEIFVSLLERNPHLRPRVGNPDEMRSNRLMRTLERLKFRVTDPEPDVPESVDGSVITALNEEAIASAGLANKGGINLIHTYEAFGVKMLGVIRQELIFTEHLLDAGRPVGWLSVPLFLTSHTWENSKNEQSHQDPTLAEALLGELSHLSRVLFPADSNSAAALMEAVYTTHGQVWSIVIPKHGVTDLFSLEEGRAMLEHGALQVPFAGHRREDADTLLIAVGAYQLAQVLRASERLAARDLPHRVVYILEPGRFRRPRNEREADHVAPAERLDTLFPQQAPYRVLLGHARPEPLLGVLRPLDTGPGTRGLGYISRGGTLDVPGLLFLNRSTWAHVLRAVAEVRGEDDTRYLEPEEREAVDGTRNPAGIIVPAAAGER